MITLKSRTRLLLLVILMIAGLLGPVAGAYAQPAQQETEQVESVEVPADEKAILEMILQVKDLVERLHPSGVSSDKLYEGMLRGLMEAIGDPHSTYLTEDEMTSLTNTLLRDYSGVGIVLKLIENELTVIDTIEGGPAEEAGIEPGDVIIDVDGVEYTDPGAVSDALRGPAGTSVVVTIRRPSTGEIHIFSLSRENIQFPGAEPKPLGDGLYYLDIDRFDTAIMRTIGDSMKRIKEEGAVGLILDLRDNSGGLLNSGVEVASHLVPKGTIVELQMTTGRQAIKGTADTVPIPVVVLVNERTASASEIVAGAIRDHGVGILVGSRTYGKGSIQQVFDLGDERGGIRVTIADYYTPSGTSISGTGLAPDLEVAPVVPMAPMTFSRAMRKGLVGLDVLALQERLAYLGYYTWQPDGVFGQLTDQAISRFLAAQGRAYSGSVGAGDVDALNAAVAAKFAEERDLVYLRGLEALKARIQTGAWPAN